MEQMKRKMNSQVRQVRFAFFIAISIALILSFCAPKGNDKNDLQMLMKDVVFYTPNNNLQVDTIDFECDSLFTLLVFSKRMNRRETKEMISTFSFDKIDTFFTYEHDAYIKTIKLSSKKNEIVFIQNKNDFMWVGVKLEDKNKILSLTGSVFTKHNLEKLLKINLSSNCILRLTDISSLQYIEVHFCNSDICRFIYSLG